MGLKSTAVVNEFLTTFAYGLMQDRLAAYTLANTLCPIVQVGAATGTYKVYDDRNAFLAPDSKRPLGGPRTNIRMEATDATYSLSPRGYECGLDDYEITLAGNRNPMDLAQLKIKTMLSKKATDYAKRAADFVFANLTAASDRGNWSDASIDPIDQIDEQLDALSGVTGSTENVSVVLGVAEWRKVRSNAKVKARLGITGGIALTREQFVNGLLFPVNLLISPTLATVTKHGQSTVTKARVMAGYCVIVHSQPSPTQDDPSFAKCFSTSPALVEAVREYRAEGNNSTMYPIDWDEDMKVTGSACARLLAIT